MKRIMATVGVLCLALATSMVFGITRPESAYAKYTTTATTTIKISVEKAHYTVKFHVNAGDDAVEGTMADQTFTYGEPKALTLNTFVREGYVFNHWNTKASDMGIDYADGATVNFDVANGAVVNLYAQWEEVEVDEMPTVVNYEGACTFNGANGVITGDDCEWADGTRKYIDTGIKLYDSENYNKDYEIGFTIIDYKPNAQEIDEGKDQATFVNAKLEDEGRNWPGLAIRKNNNNIEITQTINKKRAAVYSAASSTTKVVIARISGVVYYSVNGSAFEVLQDMQNTSDTFDTNVWFGASSKADGTPMRYLKATLSNMYIKVGKYNGEKYLITFDAQGGETEQSTLQVIGSTVPSLPTPTKEGSTFVGWFDGNGKRVKEGDTISSDVTVYARWHEEGNKCAINGVEKATVRECIDAEDEGTITLLEDTTGKITVPAGKNITFDLGEFVLSNDGVSPVITNNGTVTIVSGTFKSSTTQAVINNNSTGVLTVSGGKIMATNTKQAIYNDGGQVTISGNAQLSAVASDRATVHNLNGGTMIIIGGTITSTGQAGVLNAGGSLVIGAIDGIFSNSTPIICGATYGVSSTVQFGFYDGILHGKTAAVNDEGKIVTEEGVEKVSDTTVIDGATYQTLYYK